MSSFDSLVNDAQKAGKDIEAFLKMFFTTTQFNDYELDDDLDANERKAVKTMFSSKKDLRERTSQAFAIDPLCLEAFFVYYALTEDVFVNYRFENYYAQADNYADMTPHQQKAFIRIMDFYVDFLIDIHNFSAAIRVERLIIRLSNSLKGRNLTRLAFLYNVLEKDEDFYRLYLEAEFTTYEYILLIVTLLKHNDEYRAKEVADDMFKHIPYATYIDHLWDLDQNDEKQRAFYQSVEDCYQETAAVPDFFSFMSRAREAFEEKE